MRGVVLFAAIAVVGCGGTDQSLMPMEVGTRSRYEVQAGFNSFIGEVRVVREAAVAGLDGFVLSGPMGESKVAWKGDMLVGEQFSNTRFEPAIPLVVASGVPVRRTWKGTVQGFWGKFEGTATLDQAPVDNVDGKKFRGVKSALVILNPKGKAIKLTTLFQPGVGIYSQRQWVGGDSVVEIERLSGP